jgi:hypothetical protein
VQPEGLLVALAWWALVPIRDCPDLVRDAVLAAIKPARHKAEGSAAFQY